MSIAEEKALPALFLKSIGDVAATAEYGSIIKRALKRLQAEDGQRPSAYLDLLWKALFFSWICTYQPS